jgi:hypothetical protein
LDKHSLTTPFFNQVDCLLPGLLIDIGRDNLGSLMGKEQADSSSHPHTRVRDKRSFIVKPHLIFSLQGLSIPNPDKPEPRK